MDLSATGTGLSLSSLSADPVYWDIASEGFRHASGWVSGDTGLLCIDLNSNGVIDDNSELFGNNGPNANYIGSPPAANGFQALTAYDSNSDGVIDSNDAQFGDLRVWTDSNHDGHSQATELHTLSDLGITSINLAYSDVNYTINGNAIKQESTFTMNGDTRTIADAWFSYDSVNTIYNANYTLNIDTLFLPGQRGYGLLPDLHIAMSNDSTLLSMVQDLAGKTAAELLDPTYNLDQKVETILFQWAGVQNVDPDLTYTYFDGNFDAQKLAFLEQLMDQPFQNTGDTGNVGQYNVLHLIDAWNGAFSYLSAHILAQAGLAGILGTPSYDLATDTLTSGGVAQDIAIQYASQAYGAHLTGIAADDVYIFRPGDTPTASGYYITETANSGTNTVLLGDVNPSDVYAYTDTHGDLFIRYSATDTVEVVGATVGNTTGAASLAAEYVQQIAFQDGTIWNLQDGMHLRMPFSGGAGTDLDGTNGNDILEGNSDWNRLYGFDGNDTLVSHGGADYMDGGTGSNTYIVTSSGETIHQASGGTAAIEGITAGAFVWTDSSGNMYFGNEYHTVIYVTVEGGSFNGTTGFTPAPVTSATFTDNSVMDLTGGLHLTASVGGQQVNGTAFGDTFSTTTSGASFYGYGGDDTYTFAAGTGTNSVYENAGQGTDTIAFQGIDPANVTMWTDTYGILHIAYASGDEVDVHGSYSSSTGVSINVEQVTFDDAAHTVWDLSGLNLTATNNWQGLYGSGGADTLTGTHYGNLLEGFGGNDTIIASSGGASMYGGAGADTFTFTNAAASNTVADFSTSDSDKLDFSSILTGFDPLHDTLSDFVTKTESGGNTIFSVDTDGTGSAHSMTQVAVLTGVTGLSDLATLVANGTVIV
jgi:hypothetical protein